MPLPCNNVSVTPIKVSKLVRYSNLDGDDLLLTIESGSLLWSRRSTINDIKKSLGRLTGSYSGSFTGSFKGKSSGSFSGSYWGRILSKNTVASGSFSGSYWGRILSKNTVASGSFSGSHYGSLVSKNTKASGSFSGSHYGKVIGSKGSLITGSFRGIDNITNFRGTGKKVSFNGTASYAVSSSYAKTSSYLAGGSVGGDTFVNASYTARAGVGTPNNTGTTYDFGDINATGKTLKWFKIEGSFQVSENHSIQLNGVSLNGTLVSTNVYSSWGWTHGYYYDPDGGNIITHFTIEGGAPIGATTGTISVDVHAVGGPDACYGYVVGYF